MKKFLILDIGAGTMDILYYDAGSGMHYKAVVKSPVLTIAEKAAGLPGHLLTTGVEMGGGSLSKILTDRAEQSEIVMSSSSAATIHHDPERVKALGINIVDDSKAEALRANRRYSHLQIGDLDPERIKTIVESFGVPFSFDAVGICAQDHGVPPVGVSHLDYRQSIFKARLNKNPWPHALLYRRDEVPATFNRLSSIAKAAEMFQCDEVYVMDSGMAAILGASMDPRALSMKRLYVLDVATSHTVGAALEQGEIAGFFEYHTKDMTLERLETLFLDLAEGRLEHKKILEEGGHGAFICKAIGFQDGDTIIATGPKRRLVAGSKLPFVPGAPMGDNMMTGAVGVFEAIRRRNALAPWLQ